MKANAGGILDFYFWSLDKSKDENRKHIAEAKQQLADGLVAMGKTFEEPWGDGGGKDYVKAVPVEDILAYFGIGRNHGG